MLYHQIIRKKEMRKKSMQKYTQGLAQITPSFYYKIISMLFCNIKISHSSTPYGILGDMFKLKL